MQVFHLSHTDLDGYGCQYIANKVFDDIVFFNANYGKEVSARLQHICTKIDAKLTQGNMASTLSLLESKFRPKTKDNNDSSAGNITSTDSSKSSDSSPKNAPSFLILITDLNLTLSEAKWLNDKVASYQANGHNVKALLLDHHISGEECAKIYEWYHLDDTRCASKITYETLPEMFLKNTSDKNKPKTDTQDNAKKLESLSRLKDFIEMINAVDIWLEDGENFEFGKVALGAIASSNELNRFMFDVPHREYKFALLDFAYEYLAKGAVEFDNAIFMLKKKALKGMPDKETMDNICSRIQCELLEKMKETCTIYYGDKKGFLSYCIGGISVLANRFLRQNSEYDFYMDINTRGLISLRANGACDVSELSKEIFNGGGHKNAAGGKLDGLKESFLYEDIKSQVQDALHKN